MKRRKDLNLNSIDRFLKHSTTIHLEEYSSCETPSGCGGVVLRWINDDSPVAINITIRVASKANIWLNGEPYGGYRRYVKKGNVVLAFEFSVLEAGLGFIQAAGKNRDGDLAVMTQDDGTWKYTDQKPQSDDWLKADYNDTHWKPMVKQSFSDINDDHGYAYRSLQEIGAAELGIVREKPGPIWIRKVFRFGEEVDLLPVIQTQFHCIALGVVEASLNGSKFSEPRGFDRDGNAQVRNKGRFSITAAYHNGYLGLGRNVIGLKITPNYSKIAIIGSLVDKNRNVLAVTRPDGIWKYTRKEPSKEWLLPDYDDSEWESMKRGDFGGIQITGNSAKYEWEQASCQPAEIIESSKKWLGLLFKKPVWVRHVFEIKIDR